MNLSVLKEIAVTLVVAVVIDCMVWVSPAWWPPQLPPLVSSAYAQQAQDATGTMPAPNTVPGSTTDEPGAHAPDLSSITKLNLPANPDAAAGESFGLDGLKAIGQVLKMDSSQKHATITRPDGKVTTIDPSTVTTTTDPVEQQMLEYAKDPEAFKKAAEDRFNQLQGGTSPQAAAFNAVQANVGKGGTNPSIQALADKSSQQLKSLAPVLNAFADCKQTVATVPGNFTTHTIHHEEHCDSTLVPKGTWKLTHDYSVAPLVGGASASGTMQSFNNQCDANGANCHLVAADSANLNANVTVTPCGSGCLTVVIDPGQTMPAGGDCSTMNLSASVSFPGAAAIRSAGLSGNWSGAGSVTLNGYSVGSSVSQPPQAGQADCQSAGGSVAVDATTAASNGSIQIGLSEKGSGQVSGAFTLNISYDASVLITDRGYGPDNQTLDSVALVTSDFCPNTTSKIDSAPPMSPDGNCARLQGLDICPSDFKNAPGALNPLPYAQEVNGSCDFGVGTYCWNDYKGEQHCFTGDQAATAQTDNCQEFEPGGDKYAQCTLKSDDCIPGTEAGNNSCFARERVYDCPETVTTNDTQLIPTTTCGGADGGVANGPGATCSGADCYTPPTESSTGFNALATIMEGVKYGAMDMGCSPDNPQDCQMFRGENLQCLTAMIGQVQCCIKPDVVGLGTYIDWVTTSYQIYENIAKSKTTPQEFGVWSVLSKQTGVDRAVAQAYSVITRPLSSVLDNLGGQGAAVVQFAGEQIFNAAVQEFIQEALREEAISLFGTSPTAIAWINLVFGESSGGAAVTTTFASDGSMVTYDGFSGITTTTAADGTVTSTTATATVEALQVIARVVWIIYIIYMIETLLVNIIWQCKENDFQLTLKRANKTCVYLGSYCKHKLFGVHDLCVEKRESYCCYNTPIARIIAEQAKPMLGSNFGSADHPNCSGIPIDELSQIDWTKIDLTEWFQMLSLSPQGSKVADMAMGKIPVNIDTLTGKDSMLQTTANGLDQPSTRVNAADRATQMTQLADPETNRPAAADNAYNNYRANGAQAALPQIPATSSDLQRNNQPPPNQ
ncbi:MAG: hypothetical protein E6Q76_07425 [Rhizobium sp.]|nr:MAG: hypothetical protein E6Q76_07425 [Rhizobium sp.]